MSAGKIAEYAVGIFVPLGMFWVGEREWFRRSGVGESTPDSARSGSPESEAKTGALPPLRSPFLESGTSRIPADVAEIQRACRPEV